MVLNKYDNSVTVCGNLTSADEEQKVSGFTDMSKLDASHRTDRLSALLYAKVSPSAASIIVCVCVASDGVSWPRLAPSRKLHLWFKSRS